MRAAGLIILCAALAGCASLGSAPPATVTSEVPSKIARAQAAHEYPSPAPPRQRVFGGGSASAAVAVRSFAAAYINWSAGTVARDMLMLAAESVGQARSATALAASQTAGDYELRRGGISNNGTVEAVAPLPRRPNAYVVVTREQTTATNTSAYAGLRPAWHVTVAMVTEVTPGRWVVSGWQPES